MIVNKGLKKYIINPSLGLIPILIYILMYVFTKNVQNSLIVSLLVAIVSETLIRAYTKTIRCGLVFFITFFSLGIAFFSWIVFNKNISNDNVFMVIIEVAMVFFFIITNLSKSYLNLHFFKRQSVLQKAFMNQFYEVTSIAKYLFTTHLFILLIYKFLDGDVSLSRETENFFFYLFPVLIIISLVIYETVKIKAVVSQLRKEEWLPIVNPKGEVTGKVAGSISLKMNNRFLHPVVRIALVNEGQIYLTERKAHFVLARGALDHPFEKYMLFNSDVNTAARNSIVRQIGIELPFNFLLKYLFENEKTKRLIFLFVSKIETEEQLEHLSALKGKFWTLKQIDEDLGENSKFSECFQLEYEYLKNTVLTAEGYVNHPQS